MGPPCRRGKKSLSTVRGGNGSPAEPKEGPEPTPSPAGGSAGEVMSMETAEGGPAVPSAAGVRPTSLGPHGGAGVGLGQRQGGQATAQEEPLTGIAPPNSPCA